MITYKNIFKDKDWHLHSHLIFADTMENVIKSASENIKAMKANGYLYVKTLRETSGHWNTVYLPQYSYLKKVDKILEDLENILGGGRIL